MTSITTTSDGFSFHTMELKFHPDGKSFNKALSALYAAARKSNDPHRTTYPILAYQSPTCKPHVSTLLSPYGILLYLTESIKKDWHSYTIKAVTNPRRVLDPHADYLGIAPTDSDSLERFSDEFTTLMRKYHLPEFLEEWKLTRLDLCVNIQLNKKKSARELCRLLHKDLLPPKMERVLFFDPDASKKLQEKQLERDQHSVCLANSSYALVVYDKLFQLKTEGLDEHSDWKHLTNGVLRFELRCLQPYINKLLDGKGLDTTGQIRWLAQHSRKLIWKQAAKAFSSGTHYKPDAAKVLIKSSDYHKATREQLWWLFQRMRYPFTLEQLEKGMRKKFDLNSRTVAKRLEQLQELGINLIPLRKDFYLDQLPSLPLLLELLEDDSTTLKLRSDGTTEY